MQAEQQLTIYEIRGAAQKAFEVFDDNDLRLLWGPSFAGLHLEEEFAFVFFAGLPSEEARCFLEANPLLELRYVHQMTYAQWQDGAGAKPFMVGSLMVAPPFYKDTPLISGAKSRLIIDPGLAFGFGGHPTSRACLEFLQQITKQWAVKSALDLGCGTGVLSLAALLLGAQKAIGVDHSHLAVEAALNNRKHNGFFDEAEFIRGDARDFASVEADLLLANLHLSLQEDLFTKGAFHGRRYVVISGLLPSEGDAMRLALESVPLKMLDQVRTDRWATMLFKAVS